MKGPDLSDLPALRRGQATSHRRVPDSLAVGLMVVAVVAAIARSAALIDQLQASDALVVGTSAVSASAAAALAALKGWERDRDRLGWFAMAGVALLLGVSLCLAPASQASHLDWPAVAVACVLALTAAAGALLLIRPRVWPLTLTMWADGAMSGFGGIAVAVVLLAGGWAPRPAPGLSTLVVLPPLLLVGAVVGALGAAGPRAGRTWWFLTPALLATAVHALGRTTIDTAHPGALADVEGATAAVALVLLAVAAWVDDAKEPVRSEDHRHVTLSGVLASTSLVLLVLGVLQGVEPWVVVPAVLSLVPVAIRGAVFRSEVLALSDSQRQARTDDLTGLINRRFFYERLNEALEDRPRSEPLAVLIVDLDRFKEINDSLGHQLGDAILRMIGPRLTSAVGIWDMLARLGGDEFAVMVEGANLEWAETTADKLRQALVPPFPVGEVELTVDASIGIALWPDHGRDVDSLLARADIAMYRAKENRTGVGVYEASEDAPTPERLHLLELLRTSITSDDPGAHGLSVSYQPKFQLSTGDVEGAEALVRFNHPDGSTVLPDTFISMVENAGLMHAMTLAVLRIATRQCAQWRGVGIQMEIAVNVSTSTLLDLGFPHQVIEVLKEVDLPPTALVLEITESGFMRDRVRCLDVLHRLRSVGIKIAVDDYGTGHSSLAYLRDLPADELKLDRSFVQNVTQDVRIAAIVDSTVALAHALGLRIVAEGVETDDDLDWLRTTGTDIIQGYLLSRPLPAEEFTEWYFATFFDRPAPSKEELAALLPARPVTVAVAETREPEQPPELFDEIRGTTLDLFGDG